MLVRFNEAGIKIVGVGGDVLLIELAQDFEGYVDVG